VSKIGNSDALRIVEGGDALKQDAVGGKLILDNQAARAVSRSAKGFEINHFGAANAGGDQDKKQNQERAEAPN